MDKKSMIYLACPYSCPSHPDIQLDRFEKVSRVAAEIFKMGLFVYSPISHTHPMTKYGLPCNYEFFKKYDEFVMRECCSYLWVLELDGWGISNGVREEMMYAGNIHMPYIGVDYHKFLEDPNAYKDYI